MDESARNSRIARLIVGALSIDSSFASEDKNGLKSTLERLGQEQLLPEVDQLIESAESGFNVSEESKALRAALGELLSSEGPAIFRLICEVLTNDRYMSEQEALYLSALAHGLNVPLDVAQNALKETLSARGSRIALAGTGIDSLIHPRLKELLSFDGAEQMVKVLEGEDAPIDVEEPI